MVRGLCTFLTVVLATVMLYGCVHAGSYEKQKKMDEISRQMAKERNKEIILYGKVVDFDGEPVAGATVKMHVRIFGARKPQSSFKNVKVTTDKNGLFSIVEYGELISLDDISKHGYVYHYKYNSDRSRWSVKAKNRKNSGFDHTNPMTFRVRKNAPPAFVLSGNWKFGLRDNGLKWLDLYRRDWASPDRLAGKKLNSPDWKTDVSVRVEKDGENFKLILEAVDENSGFVVETPEFIEEMTEAPQDGYRKKLVLPISKHSGGRLFAYVKSEGGLFYSKVFVSYVNREDRDYVELGWSYFTNVAGNRGLELVPAIVSQYRRDVQTGRRNWIKREQLISGEVAMPVLGVE